MKILLVSMNSIHFRRWTSQLKDSDHEVYWFDILGAGGYSNQLKWVKQNKNWKYRFNKGRTFLKKYSFLRILTERNIENEFKKYLEEIKPDIVHSFVLYLSCKPILNIMKFNKSIKWVYSAWGNDLYFYQNKINYLKDIKETLPEIDYMFADCKRDLKLAQNLGFKGIVLGDFPGGGGYHLKPKSEIKKISERNTIFIKGYQGEKHRGLNVLKALRNEKFTQKIIFFSTDDSLLRYYNDHLNFFKNLNIKFYDKNNNLTHKEFLKIMSNSLIYIGNNLSDGMPNTMLEAICFGAFPIQSDPGGATSEIITDDINGLLINNCDDIYEIKEKILKAINSAELLEDAFMYNLELRESLEFNTIRKKVLDKYALIEKELN